MFKDRRSSSLPRSGRKGWRGLRLLAPVAVIGLIFGVLPAAPALAADPGVLTVQTTITDTNDNPITSVDASAISSYRVHVAYSCSLVDCTDVQVSLAGTQTDPTYNFYHRETGAFTFNPPFTPQPAISGSAFGGLTVSLGTVTAGTSGSYSIDYQVNDGHHGDPAGGSFFPNGSVIQPQASITASNADTVTNSAASATWVSTVPNPTLDLSSMGASTRTDTPYTVNFGPKTVSGCVTYDATFGSTDTFPQVLCAASYTTTVTLPPEAQYIAGSGGAAGAGGTVVIQNSGQAAAVGMYSGRGSYPNTSAFQVTFPSGDFPTTGAGCVATETFNVTYDVTYLDGTEKSVTASRAVQVQNCTPFAKAQDTKWSTTHANVRQDTFAIPLTPGATDFGTWRLEVDNQANVAGVGTISDTFDQADLSVYQIIVQSGGPATMNYTLSDGSSHTATIGAGSTLSAPAGLSITSVDASSSPLTGPNPMITGTAVTPFILAPYFTFSSATTPGTRTNTMTSTMTYPGFPTLDEIDMQASHTITFEYPTDVGFVANAPSAAVSGGGTALVGSHVTWSESGQLNNLPPSNTVVPQYIFLAPLGWTIDPNGASLSTPVAGATFSYSTVTNNGNSYDAVIVNWPTAVGTPGTTNLPTLQVNTTPTGAAAAGTNNQLAQFFVGDVNNSIVQDYSPTTHVDTTDLDADGVTTDEFAAVSGVTSLEASRAVAVTKQICQPDASASDGCDWISNSAVTVGVAPNATSIRYRVIIDNTGNVGLTGLVAYDVLPFIGDTGTSDGTASTPRGSSVQEQLSSVSDVDSGVTLAYSTSTNPPRPEVYSGTTTGDWTSPVAGASSIQATIPALAADTSVSFEYQAALVGATADKVACNSVAVKADLLTTIEPPAVCATTQEADFQVTTAAHLPLQGGRVGTVPFVVTNGGPSSSASGTVTLSVPAGLSVADLTVAGWSCTAPSMVGPVDVTCTPVNPDSSTRSLAVNVPETINLDVEPIAGIAPDTICVGASVTGLMFDPDLTNNDASGCSSVVQGSSLLGVTKTDGVSQVGLGQTLTYTITASNQIVSQGVTGAVLEDTLPSTVTFVSASDGGTLSGADGNGDGGVVTWPATDLAAAGTATSAASSGTGAPGSSVERTITVQVTADAPAGSLANTASLTASDPSDPGSTLQASGTDIDTVQIPVPTLAKDVESKTANPDGTWTVEYEIQVTNPDPSFPTTYSLDDSFDFPPGVTVVGNPTVASSDVTVSTTWNGDSDPAVVTAPVSLAAGATDTYTITVVIDTGTVDPNSALADCTLGAGETGTGFRGVATLTSGASSVSANACAPFTAAAILDPPAPVLGETGLSINPLVPIGALLVVLIGAAVILITRRRRYGRDGI